jgi:hypothetical protein
VLLVRLRACQAEVGDPPGSHPREYVLQVRRRLTHGRAFDLGSYVSSMIVTGPSLTSSTCIRAPKTPVCTGTPSASSAAQNAS